MEKSRLEVLSQRYLEEALEARRYIHRHPELSWKEFGTQAYVLEALRRHGIECRGDFEGTTVVGMIRGGHPGGCGGGNGSPLWPALRRRTRRRCPQWAYWNRSAPGGARRTGAQTPA